MICALAIHWMVEDMDPTVISTHGLTKTFKSHTAVDSLDLAVPQGQVYGFLGPNGSGKSTTMKMLLGLTQPTSGAIALFVSRAIGFCPGAVMKPARWRPRELPGGGHGICPLGGGHHRVEVRG